MKDDADSSKVSQDFSDLQINEIPLASSQQRENTCCCCGLLSGSNWREIKELFTLAWPTVLSHFLFHLIFMITLFFSGRLGEVELAAGTLAISFINVTGTSMFIGLASAVETLCSQAFGAGNYRLVGVVLQRGVWILGISCILTWALWVNTELVLLMVHQKENVASLTQEFVLICLPGAIGSFLFALLQRYLQAQGIVKPIFYVGIVSDLIHIGLNSLMVLGFKWNFSGVAIGWVLSTCILSLLLSTYMKVFKLDKLTWPGWTIESMLDWGQFFKLAISGMVMLCIEWWSFEVGAFITGTFGEVELAAYGILFQWAAFVYMIPLGISVAAGVRVGNSLGAGNPQAVKRTIKVAFGLIVCIEVGVVAVFAGLEEITGRLFTDNGAVLAVYKKYIRIVSVFLLFDGIQGVASGVVRGSGRQKIGVVINFIAFFILGLPLGISLTFFVFNEPIGLWIGLLSAVATQAFLYTILLWRTNWGRQAEIAQRRTAAKSVTETTLDGSLNGVSLYKRKGDDNREEKDNLIFNWICKTSSLPVLGHFGNSDDDNAFRMALLSTDVNTAVESRVQWKTQPVDDSETRANVKGSLGLTSSEKKSLVLKRLIPLVISLLVLSGAVAIRFLIPLPSSSQVVVSMGNGTNMNSTLSVHNSTSLSLT
ncbi:multidrug and toxin extrusion protein 2-like isoform X1 [Montipora capricornis]|uniref:multidrug and toxin extrusion protein 2-like isoform X1 n=1 Tax=Montipora capricornis TaxID=246305 RepID=UPI0035F1E38A